MSFQTAAQTVDKPTITPVAGGILQRACACGQHTASGGGECEECKKKRQGMLQREAMNPSPTHEVSPIVHEVLRSSGQPLDAQTRAYMEPRFGQDFSGVRIHTDSKAGESARAVNALAYTVGHHIIFGNDQYRSGDKKNHGLIAHELTHVLQQRSHPLTSNLTVSPTDDPQETEANRVADQILSKPFLSAIPSPVKRLKGQEAVSTRHMDRIPISTESASHPNLQRQINPDQPQEPQLSRSEEIDLSRNSPGLFVAESDPLTLSLYNFGIDVAQPKPEHQAVLRELGHLLDRTTSPITIRVVGFADSSGAFDYNLRLSRRRANAVKAVLDPWTSQRIAISAYGETNPVTTNETVSGRTRNRRVDIRFASRRQTPTQTLPRPRPTPHGERPQPTQPEPPGTGTPGEEDRGFCDEYPLLCGLGITPFLLPLVCLIAPEACLSVTCLLLPGLCTVPPPPPEPPDEPPERDDDDMPLVRFLPAVRAPNTPAAMNDRIGLRDPVDVMAIVVNPPDSSLPITIFVSGNERGGEATINGQTQIQITGTTRLSVLGTRLSAENYAFSPYIQLGAWWSNQLVGESNRFAVSGIAQNWSVIFHRAFHGRFGYVFQVDMDWESDTGQYRPDLSGCQYVELVGVREQTGGMANMGTGQVDDPNNANTCDYHPAYDEHGTPFEYTRDTGLSRLKQLWSIRDLRSNSNWAPSPNSGFEIERRFERDPANPRCWHLVVRKRGVGVTIGGMSTGAGAGDVSYEFRNINCDPPPVPPQPQEEPSTVPTPDPQAQPQPTTPICDQRELARRVDACIEEARQGAIECTLGLVGFSGGWGGVGQAVEYYLCLRQVRDRLLECDRQAKADTHCEQRSFDENLEREFEQCMNEESIPVPAGADAASEAYQRALERCYARTGYRRS